MLSLFTFPWAVPAHQGRLSPRRNLRSAFRPNLTVPIDDARLSFYATFLRHTVASAVDAIDESCQECLGRRLTRSVLDEIRAVLFDGLESLPGRSVLLTNELDVRMAAEIRILAGEPDTDLPAFDLAIISTIHTLMGNFVESLVALEVELWAARTSDVSI